VTKSAEKKGCVAGTGLVLEGGGMRGIYTAGVLDALLENSLFFDYVIGVSAGASHALSYISRQKDRARRVNVDYCRRPDYMGLRCLFREGSLFGMDLLFHKIPYQYDPYDFESFERNVGTYTAVVTNLETGKAEYLSPRKGAELLPAAMASCSLPLVSPPVMIGGVPYLDGGIGDSIPVRRAFEDGCRRIVVVLTQPKGYRKGPTTHKGLFRLAYRRYPEFVAALERRNESYNEVLDLIEELETRGKALVIRPEPQAGLNRLERDPVLLNGLHRSGYADCGSRIEKILDFISA
jgi:Predicted esterase of the alpha-beta hydrolase superfamily